MGKAGKQADRKSTTKAGKADEEPAAASAGGIPAALKQLALGSVFAEVLPMLPKLMKEDGAAVAKEDNKENKEESTENKEGSEGEAAKVEAKPKDAAGVFESLVTRLPLYGALGLDNAPEEAMQLFTRLEVDYGPFKRKKGNAALERIMVNVERNMSQYLNILLVLMTLNALVFRSWFACLPWLVGYQMLSLNLPMDLIRENFPQVPPVASKFRVAATMAIHALVWFFLVAEVLYYTYFLAKFPLIGLFVLHAYVVAPEVNLEAARQIIAEKKTSEASEAAPVAAGATNAGTIIAVIKAVVMNSFLVQLGGMIPELINECKAAAAKTEKKDDEKSAFEPLMEKLSVYNVLGLGLPASPEAAVESWKALKTLQLDFGPKGKKSVKDRVMTNFERNMPQYLHIGLALMSVRAFLFRSWFACLPWLVGYQMICVSFPLIRAKLPQVPPVDLVFRVAATAVFHAFMVLFFAYEAIFVTHIMEKILLTGLFVAHAYVVSPVPN